MTARILIAHLSGSKAHQIETFPLDETTEITFGRDADNRVVFDAQRDDAASRKHAVLRVTGGDTPRLVLQDLGSSNGTFVNGERLAGPGDLMPGDTVEFGRGGPKFTVDLDPRPSSAAGRTRVVQEAQVSRATRTMPAATIMPPDIPTKVGVGRETVQRMLSDERRTTGRTWMYVLAGVLALVGAGGGALYYISSRSSQAEARKLADTQAALAASIAQQAASTDRRLGMSAEDIAHKYENATVQVFLEWRAIDKLTGKPLYHKTLNIKGHLLPCYVQLPGGVIVRWLTSEDEDHTNRIIGGAGSGSGFVISPDGFIMTNKHVAAGWRIPYFAYSSDYETGQGLLFRMDDTRRRATLVDLTQSDAGAKALTSWIPEDGAIVFDNRVPVPIAASKSLITGENLELNVRFPGNPGQIEAKLVASAEDADAAEIKIETGQRLTAVTMAPDDNVRVGERVTVLGFPAFSSEVHALRTSVENGHIFEHNDIVPEPTVTEGLVSVLSPPPKRVGDVITVGSMGDAYQLTVPSSHGNSGGPVFDQQGHVIALFTYGSVSRETTTYAVPIRYARDLMQQQRDD